MFPPDIPEQPYIRTIYDWGDQVAVITEKWAPLQKKWIYGLGTVDRSGSRMVPFRGLNCDSYHDVAYTANLGKLLVCGTGDSARLFQLKGDVWTAKSEAVPGREFRAAVDGDRIALVSESDVYLMSASSAGNTTRIPMSFKLPHLNQTAPTALLIAEDSLLAAYDRGEYGGALFRLDLNHPGLAPTRILDDNVSDLVQSKSGTIWAAAGISHLGVQSGALYRIDGAAAEVVAAVSGVTRGSNVEKSGVALPGLTEISGLALSKDDRPIVALPAFGLFELVSDTFVGLYEGPLRFIYSKPNVGVMSNPKGLVVNAAGDIYVASRSLGVLLLRANNGGFELEQLIFDK